MEEQEYLTSQEQTALCSLGLICFGVAELYFGVVYDDIEKHVQEYVDQDAEIRELKKNKPKDYKAAIKYLTAKQIPQDLKLRYQSMMSHIDLLRRDFTWVDSELMLNHVKVRTKKEEAAIKATLFDNSLGSKNDIARLLLWLADYQAENREDLIQLESWMKVQTKNEVFGHLANLFRPVIVKPKDKEE